VESYESMLETECHQLINENAQLTQRVDSLEAQLAFRTRDFERQHNEVMDCATELLLETELEVKQLRRQRNVLLGCVGLLVLGFYLLRRE
jgi:hypothetical protein